jgi:phosphoribosylformylglycinamidine synthase II
MSFKRYEIISRESNSIPYLLEMANKHHGLKIQNIEAVKLYWVIGEKFPEVINEVFCDEVSEIIGDESNQIASKDFDYAIEVSFHPGVTDNSSRAALDAFHLFKELTEGYEIASGTLYLVKTNENRDNLNQLAEKVLSNPLLQKSTILNKEDFLNSKRFSDYHFPKVQLTEAKVKTYSLNVSDNELERMSTENTWALSLDEMKHIQTYYSQETLKKERESIGLPVEPTDVEMEILAQSWSEHCKHKIFASNIEYSEESHNSKKIEDKKVNSLFKSYIKKATSDVEKEFKKDWLVSVFSDNAGIVRFDKKQDVCVKVETHNSPSALDPYGGALTGILGVNRDILGCGQGSRPIANTDVFCFADGGLENRVSKKLPKKLLNPQRVLKGVHKGVEDGGNKSGIPTVNGAIVFDDDYAGKPLVYCGTVGVLPQKMKSGQNTFEKRQKPGDHIVVIGGSVGMDGIHGATFSSMELTEGAPATVVQIGDPITQKRVSDFLMEARDKELFTSLTDNGAGGISSSIGEMAIECNGAKIDLEKVPLKYPGLTPFEIMISESQERMSLSVASEKMDEFLKLCDLRGVQACVLGEFTDTGYLDVRYGQQKVAHLSLNFLHESLIPMELKAVWKGPQERNFWHKEKTSRIADESSEGVVSSLKAILSRPNIKSKEKWVRQYDHEVQSSTIVKPFMGERELGPTDAGVIWMAPHGGEEKRALAISCGISSQLSHYDTYVMTQYAIDEAVRNFVSVGGDVDKAALVDNFCWPDPIKSTRNPDGEHKLAQLVRSCEALYDMAMDYGMPFVSGKDSMKNDFYGMDENEEFLKISVPPTLLITAISDIEDCETIVTSDFKKAGDHIYVLGNCDYSHLNFSEYTRTYYHENFKPEMVDSKKNFELYRRINKAQKQKLFESIHDVSEGGNITALIESSFGSGVGAQVNVDKSFNPYAFLYNESCGRFIVSVSNENKEKFEQMFYDALLIGETTSGSEIEINILDSQIKCSIDELQVAWRGE